MRRFRWVILILSAVAGGACGSSKAKLEVRASPTGPINKPRPLILLDFNHAMVKQEALGKALEQPPVRVEPLVPGLMQWRTPKVLTFQPYNKLPLSTRVTITVPRDLRALDGHGLAEVQRFSLETPRLSAKLDVKDPRQVAKGWGGLRQQVLVGFSQPVTPAEVTGRCAYVDQGGTRFAAELAGARRSTGTRFAIRPRRDLTLNTAWRVECTKGLRGTLGPLGLAAPATASFRTYAPLKVLKVTPDLKNVVLPDGETSFEVVFNNPLASPYQVRFQKADGEDLGSHCYTPYRSDDRLSCSPHLLPSTSYTLVIKADQQDRFGQQLTREQRHPLKTSEASSRLTVETGHWVLESARPEYVAWARNLSQVEVTAARVDPARLHALLPELNWWDDSGADLEQLKIKAVTRKLPLKGRTDRYDQLRLRPHEIVGGKVPGIYYLALDAEEDDRSKTQELLLNVTDLGVVSKLSAASGLLWVVSLATGQPVAGAQVEARDEQGKLRWRGRTGADGTVATPGRARLKPPPRETPAAAQDDEDEGEQEQQEEWDEEDYDEQQQWKPRLLFYVRKGADVTFVDPEMNGGLAAHNFDVSSDEDSSPLRLRGMMHTDRGIYRPSETVHVKGLARTLRLGSGLRVPKERGLAVKVTDPRGDVVSEQAVKLSRFGGFAFDVKLRGDARLGDYQLSAKHATGTFTRSFSVEEYRPANFEVKARALEPRFVAGDTLKVAAEARFFYGAPVRGGKISWTVHRETSHPSFASYPGYVFSDQRGWNAYDSSDSQEYVTEHKGRLDDAGKATLSLRTRARRIDHDYDYLVRAEVRDEANQVIAARVSVPLHRTRTYLGLHTDGWTFPARKPLQVKLVALDPAGKPVAARGTLRVQWRRWSCAWETGGYRGSYSCSEKKATVLTRQVAIGTGGPTRVAFTPEKSGEYQLLLEGRSGKRKLLAGREISVYGGGGGSWRAEDSVAFKIIADKKRYRPGETARLVLKTPLRGAVGLLTLERDGVLDKRLLRLEPGQQSIEVPLTLAHAPNVYASVALFQGRSGQGKRGLPLLKVGVINLPVDSSPKRLKVALATDRERYRPGETVQATLQVTDHQGQPVQGEISLAAADEGVLSLINFKTPDPLAIFYLPWGLGVHSSTQYERLVQAPEPGEERDTTGGDGGSRPGSVRSRFLSTAYWRAAILTDAAGRAAVSFAAPDNLTAFRLMAVAADDGDRFGSAERRFVVNKPLQLHRALPRFFNVGDRARAGVVVHNETGRAGQASVEIWADGVALSGTPRRKLQLPAGGRVPVLWELAARAEGQAKLRFSVALGKERDAVEYRLPVQHPSVPERKLLARGTTRKQVSLPVKPPKGTITSSGRLVVSLDLDGLAGIDAGLEQLVEYPHGCLEQTTSRVIPMVMVKELARELQLARLQGPALERYLRIGVEKIGRHQTTSGGFSLWPGGKAEPYYTAYALWGLHLAGKAGLEVDPQRVAAGVKYLKQVIDEGRDEKSPVHSDAGDAGSEAFALYVLSLLGQPDAQAATKLLESADLPLYGKAFLARALAASVGRKEPAVGRLLRELEQAAELKEGKVLAREPDGDELDWYMSSDVRTTAIVLDTLTALRPRSRKIRPLVQGLLASRRDGVWATTQETLYALLALTRHAQRRAARPVTARVTLGGKAVLDQRLDRSRRMIRVSLPLSRVLSEGGGRVTVGASEGLVHYTALLRFRREPRYQRARYSGIKLWQSYLHPKTRRRLKTIKVGDVVRIRVGIRAEEELDHVVLADRLPAAFEPINMRLKTSASDPLPDDDEYGGDYEDEWLGYRYLELRDDRIDFAAEHLYEGVEVQEFLVRATTAGTFVVPPATVEEMYDPLTFARTRLRTITVAAP